MSDNFSPHTDILPAPQLTLWEELSQVPSDFVLWGGTAVALHLGHRESVDFDFFSNIVTPPDSLLRNLPFLNDAIILQREPGTLTVQVQRDGPVKISFFMVPGVLNTINPPLVASANKLKVASLLDLSAMKVKVICDRAEAKDYIDIDAILARSPITLAEAIAAAKHVYGKVYDPFPSLKALTYFDDGNLSTLPAELKARLIHAATNVNPSRLPDLKITKDMGRS